MTSDAKTTELTPAEIDTELSKLWEAEQKKRAKAVMYRQWGEMCYLDTAKEAEAEADELRVQAEPFEDEFCRRGGWNRYFLVTNANGHVHRGMNCSTCFATTQYAWLIELADCDEDAMIEEWGMMACTVCFPSAPSHPRFSEPSRRDLAAKAERDAEKAARNAAKAEKAMTFEDGSPFFIVVLGAYTPKEHFKTKVAARNALSGAVANLAYYGLTHPHRFQDTVAQLVPHLERVGFDTRKIIEAAAKRAKKEGAPHDALALVEGVL